MTKARTKWKITIAAFCILLLAFCSYGAVSAAGGTDLTVTIDTGASVTLKDTDGDGYYEIGTADELYAFAAAVKDAGDRAVNGELTADITVNEAVLTEGGTLNGDGSGFRVWKPIEYKNGSFDGNHKAISGLYLDNGEKDRMGLFDLIGEGVTVKNVGVVDSYFHGKDDVGSLVGANYGTLESSYGKSTISGRGNIGGVVGSNFGSVKDCYHVGTVSGVENNVGGVAGAASGTLEDCYHMGSVSGGGYNVGGVAGAASASVKRCYHMGTVSAGSRNTGGVVGSQLSGGAVEDCYSTGTVTAEKYVGGVIGQSSAGTVVINCYYPSGGATDGSGVAQFGIGNEEPGHTTADVAGQTVAKTAAWFTTAESCTTVGYHRGADAEDGICDLCGYVPATLSADGYYEIANAGQLFWFAQQVNIEGDTDACARLTADIDLENRRWYPIGVYQDAVNDEGDTATARYRGTLDGNDHTVSNFTAIGNGSQGLVGYAGDTAVVESLGVVNATVSGWNAGAVLAYCGTARNCYAIGCTVTAYTADPGVDGVYAGAVVGRQLGTARNCFAYNCTVTAGVGMGLKATLAAIGGSTVENSYYVAVSVGGISFFPREGETLKTREQLDSGEVAYRLGSGWGQRIGEDAHPKLGGAKIYYGYTSCGDTGAGYTNNSSISAEKPEHTGALGTPVLSADGTRHVAEWSCCGTETVEDHIPSYSVSGGVITLSCTAGCGYGGSMTVSATGKTYDGSAASATVTSDGVLSGTLTAITYAEKDGLAIGAAPVNAGIYTASITIGDSTASVEFTIAKAASSIAFAPTYDPGRVYNGAPLDDPVAEALLITGATYDDVVFTWYRGSVDEENMLSETPKDVGTYYVVASVPESNNYTASAVTGRAIAISPMVADGVTVTLSQDSLVYDGTAKTPTVASVRHQGDEIPASEYTVTYSDNIHAGTATVTVTGREGGNIIFTGSATFLIAKAEPQLTAPTAISGLTESGEAQALVNGGTAVGGTVLYSLTEAGEYSGSIPQGVQAGEYTVWYYVKGDANHNDSAKHSLTVTVNAPPPPVTSGNGSDRIEDTPPPAVTSGNGSDRTEDTPPPPTCAESGHRYENACDGDCNTCGTARTPAEHVDADEDRTCDECGASLPGGGLSGGAIAGIAVGSASALALGGFALFWFVIKKKKWSDLVGIFKKQ